jgi:interleukin-1 receptor-associated kinase 4
LAEKGSLDKFWSDDSGRSQLSWQQRLQIALDVATALSYLHGGGDGVEACFHRDIKSANICLKRNFTAQLIDCGLAKFVFEDGSTPASSGKKKVGTPGYTCPLYDDDIIVYCDKCDVYSFGVVLIELIVGRVQSFKSDSNSRKRNFANHYVKNRMENRLENDVDKLAGDWDSIVTAKFSALALECLNETNENERPSMPIVTQRLQALASEFCHLSFKSSSYLSFKSSTDQGNLPASNHPSACHHSFKSSTDQGNVPASNHPSACHLSFKSSTDQGNAPESNHPSVGHLSFKSSADQGNVPPSNHPSVDHLSFKSSTYQGNVPASNHPSAIGSQVKIICRQCKVKSFDCVECNSVSFPHLHCKSCLDRHVRDHIGENEIRCPFEGCESQPFSDGQLCDVTESNTFNWHLATRNKNQVVDEMRKFHNEEQKLMGKYHKESMDIMVPVHFRTVERCPRLFLLFEADKPNVLRHPREWVHRKTTVKARLYFFCAHSFTKVEPPITLKISQEWWLTAQPAINAALTVFSSIRSFPFSLPLVNAKGTDDDARDLLDSSSDPTIGSAQPEKLLGKAFELIADKANKDKNFYDTMSPVYKDGRFDWVLNEFKHLYDRPAVSDGEDGRNIHLQENEETQPIVHNA